MREIKLRTISLTSHRRVVYRGAGYKLVRHRLVWLLVRFKQKDGQSVLSHCCDGLRRSGGRPFISAFAGLMDGPVGGASSAAVLGQNLGPAQRVSKTMLYSFTRPPISPRDNV